MDQNNSECFMQDVSLIEEEISILEENDGNQLLLQQFLNP
jgi:hypothetical protein